MNEKAHQGPESTAILPQQVRIPPTDAPLPQDNLSPMLQFILPLALLLGQLQPLLFPGEQLVYDVVSSRMGRIGQAELRTETVGTEAGHNVRLTFQTHVKVLLFKASDLTVSELDAERLSTVRYSKRERSPIGKHDENVSIDPEAGVWHDGKKPHELASDAALDELSIIFLLRALRMAPGEEQVLVRHFDEARNPIRVRALNGVSDLYDVVEMTVPDHRQDSGKTVLRFYFSRDAARVPVRIESNMPLAGRITMTLAAPE